MNTRKFHLPGEAALLIVLLLNPLAIDLMSKSVFGISTISSVPLILSTAFPVFSFGTWNYIFQTLLVITLMVLKRSFCPGYLFSFVVGIGTFFCAFMTGRTVSLVQKFIGNHVEFYRLTKKNGNAWEKDAPCIKKLPEFQFFC
jgi:uncharacterized membrane protein YczE